MRHTTVFQIARLCTAHLDELCILRDISPDGLRADVYCPVTAGEPITIELRTGHEVSGKVAWTQDRAIGVAFDEPTPIATMLTHCSFDDRLDKIRPLRIAVDIPAILCIGEREISVRVRNISQAGMKIGADERLRPDERCEIRIPQFDRHGVIVRWSRDGESGLMLVQPMTYIEFAAWRQRLAEAGTEGYSAFS